MNFIKLHGAGNDFVVIDAREMKHMRWPSIAQKICDRHFGIGADGLILALDSKVADLRMRIFNADGSEAETCGNGLRCFAKFVRDHGILQKRIFSIETLAGGKKVETYSDRSGVVKKVKVAMGSPKFAAADIPVASPDLKSVRSPKYAASYHETAITVEKNDLKLAFVSMGNPHAIFFQKKAVTEFPLAAVGAVVEHHSIFPQHTNFEVARVINRKEIELRVWERGVGETLACGSGACAVAVMAMLKGYVDETVDIKLPGGVLTISWQGSGDVLMRGPAEQVFAGIWP
ncbi:MAG TPA: diaminopimelate epimerase [Dehalococcoidia bacterium]|nr:diaminopimelate epimerase [Dehalococcoidia bacterium]